MSSGQMVEKVTLIAFDCPTESTANQGKTIEYRKQYVCSDEKDQRWP